MTRKYFYFFPFIRILKDGRLSFSRKVIFSQAREKETQASDNVCVSRWNFLPLKHISPRERRIKTLVQTESQQNRIYF